MRYMIDLPDGWKYGFPKELPKDAVMYYGGNDYGVKKEFSVTGWAISEGYPKEKIDSLGEHFYYRQWIENED